MDFRVIDKDRYEEYDALVDRSVEGTVFHKSWWNELTRGHKGINADSYELWGAFEQERMVAGFPLPYRKALGMTWIVNPKLTPYGGAVFSREGMEKYVTMNSFSKNVNVGFLHMMRKKGLCLNYNLNTSTSDLQPFIWDRFSVSVYHTYIVDVSDLKKTWSGFEKKCRNQLNKFVNDGYVTRTGDVESLILLNNMSLDRQRHSRISDGLTRKMYGACREHDAGEVITIYKDDKPLASTLFVWDTKRAYCLVGGMDTGMTGYTSVVDWEIMKYVGGKLGLPEMDFEGSDVASIEYYLRKFGGRLRTYYAIRDRRVNLLYSFKRAYLS